MKGIVFFDRDGTLIEDAHYLRDPDLLREIPGAAEALARLAGRGYLLAVVSNQAGLARGKFGEEEFAAVGARFLEHFRARGIVFDAVEYCPHHPEGVVPRFTGACGCRKPETGMADRVLARLAVPAECPRWVVGDKMSDIVMGKRLRAGTILVATGSGEEALAGCIGAGARPDAFVPGIAEAAEWILASGDKT